MNMGRPDDAALARDYATAAAHLASEAALLMQHESAGADLATAAIEHARLASEDLMHLSRAGAPMEDAYEIATRALREAALALAAARHRLSGGAVGDDAYAAY